jgi:hypothetical protein
VDSDPGCGQRIQLAAAEVELFGLLEDVPDEEAADELLDPLSEDDEPPAAALFDELLEDAPSPEDDPLDAAAPVLGSAEPEPDDSEDAEPSRALPSAARLSLR